MQSSSPTVSLAPAGGTAAPPRGRAVQIGTTAREIETTAVEIETTLARHARRLPKITSALTDDRAMYQVVAAAAGSERAVP